MRDFLELGALDGSVPCARYHARQILWEWGLARLGDDVGLVVSELVTNAVVASASRDHTLTVRMWLLSDKARVMILVWDASPEAPLMLSPEDNEEAGRGLFLVDAISARWDWYPVPNAGGKVVRALVTE